jgi:hypothetical protein
MLAECCPLPAAAELSMPATGDTPSPETAPRVLTAEEVAIALSQLERATQLFHSGECNGREGAGIALEVARLILMQVLGLAVGDSRLAPIYAVFDGLNRLDEGATPVLFRPNRQKGTPRAGQGENSTKAAAVFTARQLIPYFSDAADQRKAARELVAKSLNAVKFKTVRAKRITERTVREWEGAIAVDPKGEMARVLAALESGSDSLGLERLTPAEAKHQLIRRLRDCIATARTIAIL